MSREKRTQVLHLLAEGNGIRGTARLMDCSTHTVTRLLRDVGEACEHYQDKTLRNLKCERVQCDEIWSFVYAKDKNIQNAKAAPPNAGTTWTWVAFDPDSKLVLCWTLGPRDNETAGIFMKDVSNRIAGRIQLTTDGYTAYKEVVESTFGTNIDYAMLNKNYSALKKDGKEGKGRVQYTGSTQITISGNPDLEKVSTSLIERQNLTMRTFMKRFVRKTCCFSKRLEDHRSMLALHFIHYNFVRIHRSLRISPAMAAGVSDHLWSMADVEALAN